MRSTSTTIRPTRAAPGAIRGQDARLVSLTLFGEGKSFLCEWGRWARFDETLDSLPGRWSIGHARGRIVLVCLTDGVRLDVVDSFEEATARGWPASLWDGVKMRPRVADVSAARPADPEPAPQPVRYHMPALRVIDDDLSADAIAAVQRAGRASTSMLQRELSIGHARAGRIIDLLERAGIIGRPGPRGLREVRGESPRSV